MGWERKAGSVRDAYYAWIETLYWTDSSTGRLHGPGGDLSPPAAMFAINSWAAYRLAQDRGSVWAREHAGGSWHQIGGPASSIMAGGGGIVCATNEANTYILAFQDPDWVNIGNARGATWAVTGRPYSEWSLYGLTPNKDSIWKYELAASGLFRDSRHWFPIGPQASRLVTGPRNLFAVVPPSLGDAGGIMKYIGPGTRRQWEPGDWQRIGGPGFAFAASPGPDPDTDELYGVSPDRRNLLKWRGTPHQWDPIPRQAGAPLIRSIVGGPYGAHVVLDDNTLWFVSKDA